MQKLAKILTIVLILCMGISLALTFMFYFAGVVPETEGTNFPEPLWTNQYLSWAKVLFYVGVVLAIVFPIISFVNMLINNPKQAVKSLGGLVLFGVIVFIAWTMADDTVLKMEQYAGSDNVPGTLKMAGASLYTMYILGGVAVFAIIFTEISKAFK